MSAKLGLHTRHYHIHEIAPYINWVYFFHAWGFQPCYAAISQIHACSSCQSTWVHSFPLKDQPKATEALKLWKEATALLSQLDAKIQTHGRVRIFTCNSKENDILLYTEQGVTVLPLLRQQSGQPPFLCLSDFIRPESHGKPDVIALFATTTDQQMEQLFPDDSYKHLMAQTLADRLAEATAEKLHQEVRTTLWGYAPDEQLTPTQMNNEEFQGIRPAIGYPSLPDISLNRVILPLLRSEEIGITLTENAMMQPHASVSGLMMAHPASRYFSVGKIGEDQAQAYAAKRDMNMEEMKPFLLANL